MKKGLILLLALLLTLTTFNAVLGIEAVRLKVTGEANVTVSSGTVTIVNTPVIFRLIPTQDANVTFSGTTLTIDCNGTTTNMDVNTADYNTIGEVIAKINTLTGITAVKVDSKVKDEFLATGIPEFTQIDLNSSAGDTLDVNATLTYSIDTSNATYDTLGEFITYVNGNVSKVTAGLANNMFVTTDGWTYLNDKSKTTYTDQNGFLTIGADYTVQFGTYGYMSNNYANVMFSLNKLGIRNFDVLDYNASTSNLIVLTR